MNTVTKTDAYPMPRVDKLIDGLSSSQLLTSHVDTSRCRPQTGISTKSLLLLHMDSFNSGYAIWSLWSSGNISTHDESSYRRAGELQSSLL